MGGLVDRAIGCGGAAGAVGHQRHPLCRVVGAVRHDRGAGDTVVAEMGIAIAAMPRAALFLAGKVFQRYRAAGGSRSGVLPDFFVGAHAAVLGCALLSRDSGRYRAYFPAIDLVAP